MSAMSRVIDDPAKTRRAIRTEPAGSMAFFRSLPATPAALAAIQRRLISSAGRGFSSAEVLVLQRSLGNQEVQRLARCLAVQRLTEEVKKYHAAKQKFNNLLAYGSPYYDHTEETFAGLCQSAEDVDSLVKLVDAAIRQAERSKGLAQDEQAKATSPRSTTTTTTTTTTSSRGNRRRNKRRNEREKKNRNEKEKENLTATLFATTKERTAALRS